MEKYFTAILIFLDKTTGEVTGHKYRNIRNHPASLERFTKFAETRGATEINLYGKISRKFDRKIKIGTNTPKSNLKRN